MITYGVYVLAYFLLSPADFPDWTERVPALGYILLWLILVVWLLPTITLFLDKFRIPTLSSILLVSFIVTKIFGSDYYYDLVEPNNQTVEKRIPTAKTAYKKWSESHQKPNRAIVITASGGGITAAFWTSLVFTELERALGPKFSSSVLLISSTSGGSVGSMYIVAQYGPDGLRQDRLGEIVKDAGSSSLGATAWGLAFPDFWRTLLGYSPLDRDRAWAQEQMWQYYLGQSNENSPVTMNSWRKGIMAGWRPVVAFNATIAETGEQLIISPIDFFPDRDSGKCGDVPKKTDKPKTRGLVDLYPGSDIKVVTAARLSAAFPIVTPTARPRLTDCNWIPFHVADGGYYDNHGTLAAIQYLRDILPEAQGKLKEIQVIQIRASDSNIDLKARSTTGAIGDLVAPLVTMYNVRSASQLLNNDQLLVALKEQWSEEVKGQKLSVAIKPLVISLNQDSPLSWYLTRKDKCRILKSWDDIRENMTAEVAKFIKTKLDGNLPRLSALEDYETSFPDLFDEEKKKAMSETK